MAWSCHLAGLPFRTCWPTAPLPSLLPPSYQPCSQYLHCSGLGPMCSGRSVGFARPNWRCWPEAGGSRHGFPPGEGCWSCHQIRRYRLWVGSSHCGFPHGGGTKGLPGPGSPESASPSLLEPSALSLLPYPLTRARCTSCPPRSIQEGTPGMFPGYPVPEVQSPHTLAPVVWEGGENPRGCLLTPSLLLKSPRIPHVVEADGRI